jgi:hypothetical protein
MIINYRKIKIKNKMNKTPLTLKALKAELEQLKKSSKGTTGLPSGQPLTETHKSSVAHDIKNSYIQNLHMKSSMFMLWVVTAVLSYGNKIPYIKGIIGFLSVVYGRTTIWKVLVKLRKAFIIFNAIIGVYMVFSTVGFSYENVLAGFVGMGHSYLEIFTHFTKKLFNWFVELFDHKLVPNIPGDDSNTNIYKKIWSKTPVDKSAFNPFHPQGGVEDSLRKSYKSLLNINVDSTTSWYRDMNNWWWLGTLALKGAAIVGVLYFGYKFVIDPLFINDLGTTNPTSQGGNIPDTTGDDVSRGAGAIALGVTKSIVKGISSGLKKLNPAYWFINSSDNAEEVISFLARQADAEARYTKLYPYTEVNPFDSWLKRMIIYYLGETTSELLGRERLSKSYLDAMTAHVVLEPIASGSRIDVTPSVGTIGLGLNIDEGFHRVADKIASVPSTPGMRPLTHVFSESQPNPFNNPLGDAASRLLNLPLADEIDEVASPVADLNNPTAIFGSDSE